MREAYLSDSEYQTYFESLSGLRSRVVRDLPLVSGSLILDIATGYGYFAAEVLKADPAVRVAAIDISTTDIMRSRQNLRRQGLEDRVTLIQMDAAQMAFPDECFDMAVNFLGLEDIHMTRGRSGLAQTLLEAGRVIKPEGHLCLTVMPADRMETPAQRTEVGVFSYICDATWCSVGEYVEMVERAGFKLGMIKSYRSGKKLTPDQAKREIRFACDNVPRIYGKTTPSFEEVWSQFGPRIEKHGLGHYSKLAALSALRICRRGSILE